MYRSAVDSLIAKLCRGERDSRRPRAATVAGRVPIYQLTHGQADGRVGHESRHPGVLAEELNHFWLGWFRDKWPLQGVILEQAIEKQAHLAHFGAVVEAFERQHVDGEGALVADFGELLNQFAVVDFALADADLQLGFRRVAQVDVLDVLHHFVDRAALMRAGDVVARVEREPQAFDVVAEDDCRVGVLRHAADLRFESDDGPFERGDLDQLAKPFDLFVEGGAELGRGDDERDDFDRLGEAAAGSEVLVIGLAIGVELDAQRGDIEPVGVAAEVDAALQVGVNFGRFEPAAGFVDRELERREAEIDHALEHFLRREIGKGLNRSTNEHQVAPSKEITSDEPAAQSPNRSAGDKIDPPCFASVYFTGIRPVVATREQVSRRAATRMGRNTFSRAASARCRHDRMS